MAQKMKKRKNIWRLFTSDPSELRAVKAILGFPFGALLAFGLHHAVVVRLRLPHTLEMSLSGVFLITLGLGYALSVQARCIALLIVPTFCGKTGRGYIGAFALSYLLIGPVANIIGNAHEVTRSITCSNELAQNLSEARLELQLRPLKDIMDDLMDQAKNIDTITSKVAKEFQPIRKEVEDDGEVQGIRDSTNEVDSEQEEGGSRSQQIEDRHNARNTHNNKDEKKEDNYEKKLDYRCEDVWNMGVKRCKDKFKEAEAKCKSKVKFMSKLFCWPLKITAICKLVRVLPQLAKIDCNSMEAVNDGFGEGYQTAEEASDALDNNFDVNIQYQVVKAETELDQKTAKDVTLAVEHQFEGRRWWANFIIKTISRLTAFLFIRVFLSAMSYQKKFARNLQHDNTYITDYFRHIDNRRKKQHKMTLLPLKKIEKREVTSTRKFTLTKAEKSKLVKGSVRVIMRAMMFGMVIVLDRLFYEVLDIIRRHSNIKYEQTGEHHISLTVYGDGAMGKLVKSLLNGFNSHHTINQVASNFACLPQPHLLSTSYIVKIGLVLGATWLLILLEAYAVRCRRIIAAFFYRKREKKRVLYLYNEMMKKRKGFLKHMRRHVKEKARERRLEAQVSVLARLRQKCPRLCCCVRVLGWGKRKCLVCEEPEDKTFKVCPTHGCHFGYCHQCWIDINEQCYACRDEDDWTTDSDLSDSMDGSYSDWD